jgi:hypothetical protein
MEQIGCQGISELDPILETAQKTMQRCVEGDPMNVAISKSHSMRSVNGAGNTWDYWDRMSIQIEKRHHVEFELGTPELHEPFWNAAESYMVEIQQKRCLLLDTVYGLTDDEAIWTAMACWAVFKPRDEQPRKYPGRLYYPAQFSHIMEKYWSHIFDLPSHPDFVTESEISNKRMTIFSQALRSFKRTKNWQPQVDAEAPEKGLRIAQEAAVSRVHLIADGPNQWEVCRGRTGGAGCPSVGTESSPLSGSPVIGVLHEATPTLT